MSYFEYGELEFGMVMKQMSKIITLYSIFILFEIVGHLL